MIATLETISQYRRCQYRLISGRLDLLVKRFLALALRLTIVLSKMRYRSSRSTEFEWQGIYKVIV
jgi:hypothetical protein